MPDTEPILGNTCWVTATGSGGSCGNVLVLRVCWDVGSCCCWVTEAVDDDDNDESIVGTVDWGWVPANPA